MLITRRRGGHTLQHQQPRMVVRWLSMVLLCLLPALAQSVQSATPCPAAELDKSRDVYDLGSCISYLEDPDQSLTLNDVRDESRYPFAQHRGGVLNFGYTHSTYWARFDLDATRSKADQNWILELALPLVDDVKLYVVENDQLILQRSTGYNMRWSERDLAVPNPTFRLPVAAGSSPRIYMRVTTTNAFRLPVSLWRSDSYIEKVSIEEAIRGLLLGSILAILAYNLFVAVSVRERSNIYYVLYLVAATVFIATEQVHGMQLLDKRPVLFDKQYLPFQIMTTWFFGLLMARSLLETRIRAPGLDRVIMLCLYSVVCTFGLGLFLPYHITMEWIVVGTIWLCLVMIVVSYLSWRYYNTAARAYFFAWTVALLGFVTYALTVIGFLPLNMMTNYSPQIGLTGQIILFSFALADRIKQVQGEALSWSQRALANLRRYQSLFDNAVEGMFQISLDRRFITANAAMADMLGFENNRELVATTQDVLAACFADERARQWVIGQLAAKGMVKAVEARYINRQGEERWATISLHTVYDTEGNPLHLEGTSFDVTERYRRHELEKEREHERMEKELARSSAQAKSQFLANMSHEIRTPLAAIIGYGETLLDLDLSDEEKRSSAQTVVVSGRHLLDLVNDILDHSKVDANKLEVDIIPVNLPALLAEIRAYFEPRAQEKGLAFSIECDFPLPAFIQTDPTRLRQIIINLCGNALKFTDKGAITLYVSCDPLAEMLEIRVVDTGIGMKNEQLQRLFDPFAQGSAAIARQYGGTGLGLSISRRLAELLGGSITVSSTYGDGSEFKATVTTGPLQNVRFLKEASELIQPAQIIPVVTLPKLQGRILCVEDNEVNRKLVTLLVARTGAELTHASNGAEALDVATHQRFDLILMDIQMPVMNGRDATAALREAGINTPIIALTANVMSEDIDDYRAAGCTEHLAKPIDKASFYNVLSRYLSVAEDHGKPLGTYQGKVIVAEDNAENRDMLRRMLERLGVEVVALDNGAKAVQCALSQTIQLVFMGRLLAELNGEDAVRLLRQAGFRRPIIALASSHDDDGEALRAVGCEDELINPVAEQQLVSILERWLTPAVPDSSQDIEHLVALFLAGLDERRRIMTEALTAGDLTRLQAEAHQIKGTAGAMGFPQMTELADYLEKSLKAEPVYWQAVERHWAKLNDSITQALSSATELE